jgi:hypothetical protein
VIDSKRLQPLPRPRKLTIRGGYAMICFASAFSCWYDAAVTGDKDGEPV